MTGVLCTVYGAQVYLWYWYRVWPLPNCDWFSRSNCNACPINWFNYTSCVAIVNPKWPRNVWRHFCVVTLLFGFFSGCRAFCHRTESNLFLSLLHASRKRTVFRTPASVLFETWICSNCWDQFPTFHLKCPLVFSLLWFMWAIFCLQINQILINLQNIAKLIPHNVQRKYFQLLNIPMLIALLIHFDILFSTLNF